MDHPLQVSLRIAKLPRISWQVVQKALGNIEGPTLPVLPDAALTHEQIILTCSEEELGKERTLFGDFLSEHHDWFMRIRGLCAHSLVVRVGYNAEIWATCGVALPAWFCEGAKKAQLPVNLAFYPFAALEDWTAIFANMLMGSCAGTEMNPFDPRNRTYSASLIVHSDALSPESISDRIDLKPTSTTPKGTKLRNRFVDCNVWVHRFAEHQQVPEIENAAGQLIGLRQELVKALCSEASAFLDLGIFPDTFQCFMEESTISVALLEVLAGAGLDLVVSTYPPLQLRSDLPSRNPPAV